jgi:hypothetical protein
MTNTYLPLNIGAFEEINITDETLGFIGVNNPDVADLLRQRRDYLAGVGG